MLCIYIFSVYMYNVLSRHSYKLNPPTPKVKGDPETVFYVLYCT
jgi:hypothetical protein